MKTVDILVSNRFENYTKTRDDDTVVSQGWGENGQSILKLNFVTGEIAVVMINQNPDVDQTESGVEQLTSL